jgi:2,5-furandicarboxylate decarboxylase 1
LVVITGAQGSVLDPSTTVGQVYQDGAAPPAHLQGLSAKMGLDATRPVVYHEHIFTKVRIPGEAEINPQDELHFGARIDWETGNVKT